MLLHVALHITLDIGDCLHNTSPSTFRDLTAVQMGEKAFFIAPASDARQCCRSYLKHGEPPPACKTHKARTKTMRNASTLCCVVGDSTFCLDLVLRRVCARTCIAAPHCVIHCRFLLCLTRTAAPWLVPLAAPLPHGAPAHGHMPPARTALAAASQCGTAARQTHCGSRLQTAMVNLRHLPRQWRRPASCRRRRPLRRGLPAPALASDCRGMQLSSSSLSALVPRPVAETLAPIVG